MPFLPGPPRDIVFGWAQDFAEAAIAIYGLPAPDAPRREETMARLKAEGSPATLPELVELAAATVTRQKLGWYRRNQFFGSLQGFCILAGMARADAAYLAGLIRARVRQGPEL